MKAKPPVLVHDIYCMGCVVFVEVKLTRTSRMFWSSFPPPGATGTGSR